MTTLGRLGSVFATFGAVIDVARAVEARRMPDARDLKTLGIDQSSFQRIHFAKQTGSGLTLSPRP